MWSNILNHKKILSESDNNILYYFTMEVNILQERRNGYSEKKFQNNRFWGLKGGYIRKPCKHLHQFI